MAAADDAMPHAIDPPSRNWLASANNRLADDSFPYPLGGTWASYPHAYQEEFCRDLFYAANTFWQP